MPLTQLAPPYPIFTDKNGDPLDAGYLYFGVVNQNPETNPIQVYYDAALTQPAAQPIRTINGYPSRNGSPALIYANSYFSVTVRNKNNELVIYSPVGYGILPGTTASSTDQLTYNEGSTGAVSRILTSRLQDYVSVKDFGAVGDGVADDTVAIQAAFSASNGKTIVFPKGSYLVSSTISLDGLNFADIRFNNATILAGANNLTVFKSITNAWGVKIFDPTIFGNGFTGVVAFDVIRLEQLGAGIFRPTLRELDTGIFLRSLCVGCNIDDPDIVDVDKPIIVLDSAGGVRINHPRITNFGAIGIDIRPVILYTNIGVQILGGYVQNGDVGIQDAATNTQVQGTYFERNTVADVSLVSGSSYFFAYGTNHTANIGAAAYKGRNADAAYIENPYMSASGRTGLFDFDGTNTNCVYDVIFGTGFKNKPIGTTTGIAQYTPKQSSGTFTPTIAGATVAGTATYSSQVGTWQRIGDRVFVDVSITWTGHTGSGVMQIVGVPAANPITQELFGQAVYPGFAYTGPNLYVYPPSIGGANTKYNIAQVATTGVLSFVPFAAAGTLVAHMEYLTT